MIMADWPATPRGYVCFTVVISYVMVQSRALSQILCGAIITMSTVTVSRLGFIALRLSLVLLDIDPLSSADVLNAGVSLRSEL
jgi:hypothetical protein